MPVKQIDARPHVTYVCFGYVIIRQLECALSLNDQRRHGYRMLVKQKQKECCRQSLCAASENTSLLKLTGPPADVEPLCSQG